MTETRTRSRILAPDVTVAVSHKPYCLFLPLTLFLGDQYSNFTIDHKWPLVRHFMAKMNCFKSMLLLLNKGKIVGFGNRMTRAPQASLKKGLTKGRRGNGKSQLMP